MWLTPFYYTRRSCSGWRRESLKGKFLFGCADPRLSPISVVLSPGPPRSTIWPARREGKTAPTFLTPLAPPPARRANSPLELACFIFRRCFAQDEIEAGCKLSKLGTIQRFEVHQH